MDYPTVSRGKFAVEQTSPFFWESECQDNKNNYNILIMRHNIIASKPSGILHAKGLFIMEIEKRSPVGRN